MFFEKNFLKSDKHRTMFYVGCFDCFFEDFVLLLHLFVCCFRERKKRIVGLGSKYILKKLKSVKICLFHKTSFL